VFTSGAPPSASLGLLILGFFQQSHKSHYTIEMENAGFPINKDMPGVRCHGTDLSYTTGWTVIDTEVGLSDALINVPLLKQHTITP